MLSGNTQGAQRRCAEVQGAADLRVLPDNMSAAGMGKAKQVQQASNQHVAAVVAFGASTRRSNLPPCVLSANVGTTVLGSDWFRVVLPACHPALALCNLSASELTLPCHFALRQLDTTWMR